MNALKDGASLCLPAVMTGTEPQQERTRSELQRFLASESQQLLAAGQRCRLPLLKASCQIRGDLLTPGSCGLTVCRALTVSLLQHACRLETSHHVTSCILDLSVCIPGGLQQSLHDMSASWKFHETTHSGRATSTECMARCFDVCARTPRTPLWKVPVRGSCVHSNVFGLAASTRRVATLKRCRL